MSKLQIEIKLWFRLLTAFHEVNKNYPSINLYTKDLRHPSPAGTYLAAAVLFGSIYKKSPER